MQQTGDTSRGPWRLGMLRGTVVVAPVVLSVLFAVACITTSVFGYLGMDWARAQTAARMLFVDGDLAVYAHYPEAQMGPLALLLAAVLTRPTYLLVGCLMLGGVMALILSVTPRRATGVVLAGGALVAVPWSFYASTGHLDDGLVALGAVGMVVGARRHLDWLIGVAFVVAITGKPTAALLFPSRVAGRRTPRP